MCLEEVSWEGINRIDLYQVREGQVSYCCEYGTEFSAAVKCGKIFEQAVE